MWRNVFRSGAVSNLSTSDLSVTIKHTIIVSTHRNSMIPIEVVPYPDPIPINRMAQESTKKYYPWWWDKYGCEGTVWYPHGEKCRDLTNE